MAKSRNPALYTRVFLLTYGPPPWNCDYCNDLVWEFGKPIAVIHHKDGNHLNNDPNNLTAMHWNCHCSHHLTGRPVSQAHKEKLIMLRKGKPLAPETRRKIQCTLQKLTPEEQKRVREIYAKGLLSMTEIGELFGTSNGPIRLAIKQHPLKRINRCTNGHTLTSDNVYFCKSGTVCKTCKKSTSLKAYYTAKSKKPPQPRKPQPAPVFKPCDYCKNDFIVRHATQKYCNYICSHGARRTLSMKLCLYCNEKYFPKSSTSKFCCRSCSDAGRKTQARNAKPPIKSNNPLA